jgi:Ca2+-binding RTX toxin-like protein
MTSFDFSSLVGTTETFSIDEDVLSLDGSASLYRLRNDGEGNLIVVAFDTNEQGILGGITLKNITTSNMIFATDSKVFVGDNTSSTITDDIAQIASGALDLVTVPSADLDKNNLFYGMGGGDTIKVGNGDNVIFGGTGEADSVDGSDTITIDGTSATSGSNLIYANAGNDTVIFVDPTAATASSTVYGGLGNDDIITGASLGILTLFGGAGKDTITGTGASGQMLVYGGSGQTDSTDGDDIITTGIGDATVYGNAGADSLAFDDFGVDNIQRIYAGLGNDTLSGDVGGSGSLGELTLYGNGGDDSIDVRTHYGDVTIFGGNGAVDSTDGAETILVGTGNANHHATIYGNAGNDTITTTADLAAGESIVVYGGLGVETFNISGNRSATSVVTLSGNAGNDIFNIDDTSLSNNATITVADFELTDVINITLSGGSATDLVITNLGSSAIITNGASDGVYAFTNYTGNFTATNFILSDDSILLTHFGAAAGALAGGTGGDQIICGDNGDTVSAAAGADHVIGGDGADSIGGGDGSDTLYGGSGNDSIDSGDGGTIDGTADNYIYGEAGSDSLTGGIYEDSIVGGTGNDTLTGAAGADTLTGSAGGDTFNYAVALVDATDTNVDLITDGFTGYDVVNFTDLTNTALRGTGASYAEGDASSAQTLGANVGLYVATNAVASFAEDDVYAALGGIADDLANGDMLYVMVSDNTDARLVRITETATAGTLVDTDDAMVFVARFAGLDTTELAALAAGNFADFI